MLTYEEAPGRLTHKQIQILDLVIRGAPDGDMLDLDQLLESLPYETSKPSLQFSLRGLVRRGFVEKRPTELRRGRRRVVYAPTMRGIHRLRDDSSGGGVIIEGDL